MTAQTTRGFALHACLIAALLTFSTLPASAGGITHPSRTVNFGAARNVGPWLAYSALPAQARLESVRTVDMRSVPPESSQPGLLYPRFIPLLTGVDPVIYRRMKEAAAYNFRAPINPYQISEFSLRTPLLPVISTSFPGMADSTTICPPSGCEPPDQALAASTTFVIQGVNTSFDVFNTSGVTQTGWPKTAKSLFGIPNPGSCSPSGPFDADPRAFYDPNTGHFWLAILEVEGPPINSCPDITRYWIGVSATSDPRGTWHIYSFDMSLGTTNFADYTQFGFDQNAIYFSGNMFSRTTGAFVDAEIFGADKTRMQSGLTVTAKGFFNLKVGGLPVDTVQPAETEQATGPGVELFANSFNFDFGGGLCSGGCTGVVVWAFANVLSTPSLTGVVIPTTNYFLAPNANEPGCVRCIESDDTRITGTPIVSGNNLYFALETGVFTGTSVVPGVFWAEVKPTLSGTTITGGSVVQSGHESFTGTRAASFGTLMVDKLGNEIMVFDSMSSTLDPGIYVTGRKPTDPIGTLEAPTTMQAGISFTMDSRWGDYEATSYDGFTDNKMWVSSEYAPANHDWATRIGSAHP